MTIHIEDLANMDFADVVDPAAEQIPPTHPGEILLHDFLEPLGLSQYALAKAIDVPPRRIKQIIKAQRSITANMALRLVAYFANDTRS